MAPSPSWSELKHSADHVLAESQRICESSRRTQIEAVMNVAELKAIVENVRASSMTLSAAATGFWVAIKLQQPGRLPMILRL